MASKSKSTKKTAKPKLLKRANKALNAAAKADGKTLHTKHGLNNVRAVSQDEIPEFLKKQTNGKPMTASEVKAAQDERTKRWEMLTGGLANSLSKALQRSEQAQFFGFLLDHINIVVMGHMLTYIAIALNLLQGHQIGVAFGVSGLALAYFAVIQRRSNREGFSKFLTFLSQVAVVASYAGWLTIAVLAK